MDCLILVNHRMTKTERLRKRLQLTNRDWKITVRKHQTCRGGGGLYLVKSGEDVSACLTGKGLLFPSKNGKDFPKIFKLSRDRNKLRHCSKGILETMLTFHLGSRRNIFQGGQIQFKPEIAI